MLLTAGIFVVAAVVLVLRRRVRIEVVDHPDGESHVEIHRPGSPGQVIPESQVGYVKLEEGRVTIHYYEGDDLRRLSVSTKGADKADLEILVEVLQGWQAS